MECFVDESMRRGPAGLYVVAAVVVEDGQIELAERRVRSVLLPKQRRFHWRDEGERQRRRMLDQVAYVAAPALAYVRRGMGSAQEARARALCVERLVWDLRELGCEQLIFESRERHNDRKDQATIGHAQRAGKASARLRFGFARPDAECLLWLPDAVAGAVAMSIAEGDASGFLAIEERLRITHV